MPDFTSTYQGYVQAVESAIDRLLPKDEGRPRRIHEAMRYSLQAGGKRLRPILVLAAAKLGEAGADPLPAAVAVECIHTYSLIHDDLPCMDNDDFRRGRPTAHRKFDESTALLAGDALLTFAFELLANHYASEPRRLATLVTDLAKAAGSRELIGGQMEDLLGERQQRPDAETLHFIHRNKTAAMIRVSLQLGYACTKAPTGDVSETLARFGEKLGLTFQIVDDILDATADSATLGKTAGKDAKADKTTFVKLLGLAGARQEADRYTSEALAELGKLPGDTQFLRDLTELMLRRDR